MKSKKITYKVILTLLGYVTLLFSYMIPRNKKIWIIGSLNQFNCNSKYFFIYFNEHNKRYNDIKLVWISRSKNTVIEMKKKGIANVEYIWSPIGIYYLLTAYVYITSYPVEESLCLWTMGNAKYINLWHGVGLKYHRFMQTDKKSYYYFHHRLTKILLRPLLINFYKKFDIFISTSDIMTELFKKSFKIKNENIYKAVYPRCEFILNDINYIKYIIYKYDINNSASVIEKLHSYHHTFLYMPTWRDNMPDFIHRTGIDFDHLNSYLCKRNELFLLKVHPRTPLPQNLNDKYSNILVLENNIDIYSIIPFINTLITDYSSIYYDSLLIEKIQKILFPFDIEEYQKNNRNLAFSFDSCTIHPKVYTYNQLLNVMENYSHIYIQNANENSIKNMFWSSQNNTDDIINAILKL